MLEIVWLQHAEADLNNIVEHIAKENIDAAIMLFERVIESSRGLLAHPKIGRSGKVKDTRERIVSGTKYIIVYRVTEKIEILRILHGAQQWPMVI